MSEAAFTQLLREHGGLLARIAACYEARPSERADLSQEIAMAIWRALPRFRGASSLRTFVARIAHNRGVSHVIVQRRDGRVDPLDEAMPDPQAGPQAVTEREQRRAALMAAVRRLPLAQAQVVSLVLEDFSHAEIADVLGISVNHVDVRLSRARQALRRELGEPP